MHQQQQQQQHTLGGGERNSSGQQQQHQISRNHTPLAAALSGAALGNMQHATATTPLAQQQQ
jgi:hypothetical protein